MADVILEKRSDEESRSTQEIPVCSKNEMLHFVQYDIKGLHLVSEIEPSRATSKGFLACARNDNGERAVSVYVISNPGRV